MIKARSPFVLRCVFVLLCACGVGACGDDGPTSPSTSTEFFLGVLAVQGDAFYSFTAAAAGAVDVTLVSMTAATPGPALTSSVSIGIGTPQGEGCTVASSTNTAPGFSSQLTGQVTSGIHCIDVHDAGTLSSSVTFAIRIVHP